MVRSTRVRVAAVAVAVLVAMAGGVVPSPATAAVGSVALPGWSLGSEVRIGADGASAVYACSSTGQLPFDALCSQPLPAGDVLVEQPVAIPPSFSDGADELWPSYEVLDVSADGSTALVILYVEAIRPDQQIDRRWSIALWRPGQPSIAVASAEMPPGPILGDEVGALRADGGAFLLDTRLPLVAGDTDGSSDVYRWVLGDPEPELVGDVPGSSVDLAVTGAPHSQRRALASPDLTHAVLERRDGEGVETVIIDVGTDVTSPAPCADPTDLQAVGDDGSHVCLTQRVTGSGSFHELLFAPSFGAVEQVLRSEACDGCLRVHGVAPDGRWVRSGVDGSSTIHWLGDYGPDLRADDPAGEGGGDLVGFSRSPRYWAADGVVFDQGTGRPPLFDDVLGGHPFYDDIAYLTDTGVAAGYPDGSFLPAAVVTRQTAAAFLYRFQGSPEWVTPPASPFTDVEPTNPFYGPITWLADQGIATGYPDGTFQPRAPVSRQVLAAMLYRLSGEPPWMTPPASPFTDLPTTSPFFGPVTWLVDRGVIAGFPDGTFGPTRPVSRQVMAAFLRRFD